MRGIMVFDALDYINVVSIPKDILDANGGTATMQAATLNQLLGGCRQADAVV